ncbi:hypothetical protein Trydic_g10797 [Trypoxylus dichotomus]
MYRGRIGQKNRTSLHPRQLMGQNPGTTLGQSRKPRSLHCHSDWWLSKDAGLKHMLKPTLHPGKPMVIDMWIARDSFLPPGQTSDSYRAEYSLAI